MAALCVISLQCIWAVQLQDSTFAMSFRVAKDEFDRSCEVHFEKFYRVHPSETDLLPIFSAVGVSISSKRNSGAAPVRARAEDVSKHADVCANGGR